MKAFFALNDVVSFIDIIYLLSFHLFFRAGKSGSA